MLKDYSKPSMKWLNLFLGIFAFHALSFIILLADYFLQQAKLSTNKKIKILRWAKISRNKFTSLIFRNRKYYKALTVFKVILCINTENEDKKTFL